MIEAPGISKSTSTRINAPLRSNVAKPVSVGTGSGTPAVYHPPTVAPPPNAAQAVMQQLNTSTQLAENTATGAGIGAGNSSVPITVPAKSISTYLWLGGLGVVLILAVLVDRGKL